MAIENTKVFIQAPNFKTAVFKLVGKTALVMNKFSQKARETMRAKQEAGSRAKKGQAREAKDFAVCYDQAFHRSADGWPGMPASAFRAALVSACRLVGFQMTRAKLALFVEHDGTDVDEGTPLVRIHGEPRPLEMYVRNETGVADIRVRPIFDPWWAELRIQYDADIFSQEDVANLLMRSGLQVGVGEGRPDSKKSVGMGWGTFEIGNRK